MALRIVVALNSDLQHMWDKDSHLGQRIAKAYQYPHNNENRSFDYGKILEVSPAFMSTLAVSSMFDFEPLAHVRWDPVMGSYQTKVMLLRRAALQCDYEMNKIHDSFHS